MGNTTLALALATTTSAVKITSTNVFDDIGSAFDDAYDWTKGAVNDAGDWIEGAGTDAYDWTKGAVYDIGDFAKDNQEYLIDAGIALVPMGNVIYKNIYDDKLVDDVEYGVEYLVEEEE